MTFGADFKYDTLKDELVIGEIYVRVYNEQPTYVLEVHVVNQQSNCYQISYLSTS